MDDRTWRTGPLWDWRDSAAKGGVIHLIKEHAKEGGGLRVWVRLELGVDVDAKRGGDGREKTSLSSWISTRTFKYS